MTGAELRDARGELGTRWFGRPMTPREMGAVLGLTSQDLGARVLEMERREPTGTVAMLVDRYLAGAEPPPLRGLPPRIDTVVNG